MSTASSAVGVIVDGWMDRLARGERIDPTPEFAAYPELVDRLRGLLSALGVVTAIPADPGKPTLPGYRIVREIGRGGMGVVFEAVDETLGRRVAVKVLPPHLAGHADYLARFRREARTAAGLHHTHIVPVFGVGEHAGTHFFVMQFIPGRPASTDTALSPDRIAEVGAKLADALACAHAAGVLHRDIKPGNVLLDDAGEPWLADFGLARVEADGGQTEPDAVVGTLRYAAPERFAGVTDARSDVYALGLTLYELATGQPAFDGPDRPAILKAILETEPARPRAVNPAIPRDLETVILKAIARDPAQRYASAADFADDLRRVRDGLPILARRIGPLGQLKRWAKRHPVIAGLAAALFVALTAGATLSTWQWRRAVANLTQAEENAEAARLANAKTLTSVRGFYRGMDKFPEFLYLPDLKRDKPDDRSAKKWQAFEPILAVYDEVLREPPDGEGVRDLQARAAVQIGYFLTYFEKFADADAAFRLAADRLAGLPPDAELDATLYRRWGVNCGRDPDAARREESFARVRAHYARSATTPEAKTDFAVALTERGTGPLRWADPSAARDALRESLALHDELQLPASTKTIATTSLPSLLHSYADVCLAVDDVAGVVAVAESRERTGQWYVAAALWARCYGHRTADSEEYAARAVTAIDEYLSANLNGITFQYQFDTKPLVNHPDYKAVISKHVKAKQARDKAFADAKAREAVERAKQAKAKK